MIIKKSRSFSDILGMAISLICAIQCALTPILLSVAPIIPRWAHFGHGWIWISIIVVIALWSLGQGIRRHGNKRLLYFAASGIVLLIIGNLIEERLSLLLETLIFVSGGLMLTYAHWKNFKLTKSSTKRTKS